MNIIQIMCKAGMNKIAGEEYDWHEMFEVIAYIKNPSPAELNAKGDFSGWTEEDVSVPTEDRDFLKVEKLPEELDEAVMVYMKEQGFYAVCISKGTKLFTVDMPDDASDKARNLVHLFC